MDKNSKTLITLTLILGLFFFLGLYLYFKRTPATPEQINKVEVPESVVTDGPKKGEIDYQEPQTKIEIGTQGVTKGIFEKVENSNIFLKEADKLIQLPLTVDEIAVSCTTQDLSTATELDFNQVKKVNIATPSNLATFIPVQETIVVFAQNVEGVNRAHTIALDASKCSE